MVFAGTDNSEFAANSSTPTSSRRSSRRVSLDDFPMQHIALPRSVGARTADRVIALSERQGAVVRRAQLLDEGLAEWQVDRLLANRTWQADADGLIVVLHNGPPTIAQAQTVAVLGGGRVCALAARTAAANAGLTGWEAQLVEVLVPRGTTYPRLRLVEVKVHESRRFTSDDIHPATWPPRVRIERAVVDAAVWSRRPRTACGVMAAAVQQRLTSADRLRDELDRAGAVRHRRLLGSVLADIGGGAHAMSEVDFIRFCERNGLPKPVHQTVRRDSSGRRRYLDATLVGPDGTVVRVEIDGALHLVVQTYWSDMYRGNDLSIARETALRFPSFVIHANDADAVAQLRAALGLSGSAKTTAA